ncbi:MAG: hypothetical protein IJL26_03905, partial [Clostridia bacterium]|nr:hypothetical protein [Clostridia bacterium]
MKKVIAILLTVIMIYPACGLMSFAEGGFILVEPLPKEDGDTLSDGDFWFDEDGWFDALEVLELYLYAIGENTEYYLEDDGNTITVITESEGPGYDSSVYYCFRDGVIPVGREVADDQILPVFLFEYLCRHGETGPRWRQLPLEDSDWLEDGDFYFDLDAFTDQTDPAADKVAYIQDVSWYISSDGSRLRTIMRDGDAFDIADLLPDDGDSAVFFAYVRQHGVEFVCRHLMTEPVGTVPVCKGQWLDVSGAEPRFGTYTYAVCRQCGKVLCYDGDALDAALSIEELAAFGIVPMTSLSHPDGDGDGVCDACGAYKLGDEISCGRYWLDVPQADAPYKSKAVIWGAEQDGTTCFELYLVNMMLQPEDEEYAILFAWIAQPAGHDFDDTIAANVSNIHAPTCTASGNMNVKCSRCDATKLVSISPTGHAYGEWTKLNKTYHQRVCANDATHVEKAKHTWQRMEYIKDDSGAVVGKRYVCTDCGAKKNTAVIIDDSVDTPTVPEEEGTTAEAPEQEGTTAEPPEEEGVTIPEEEFEPEVGTTAEPPEEEGVTIPEEEFEPEVGTTAEPPEEEG